MSTVTDLERPAALDRDSFEAALLAAIEPYKTADSRFCRLVARRRCPPRMMLRYAQAVQQGAESFSQSLSMLIDRAPDPAARLILLENLMEEEGIELRPGRGFIIRSERRHPEIAKRFVRACGGEPDSNAQHALAAVWQMQADRPWVEAVAFLLIGQELKYAESSQALFKAFRQCGFDDYDIAFFAIHGMADLEHGRQAIELVLDHAATRDEQERCIAAAGAAARHWFEMHGGLAKD